MVARKQNKCVLAGVKYYKPYNRKLELLRTQNEFHGSHALFSALNSHLVYLQESPYGQCLATSGLSFCLGYTVFTCTAYRDYGTVLCLKSCYSLILIIM